ncbi:hypothetical protein ABK040_010065 [Willaertia magna]
MSSDQNSNHTATIVKEEILLETKWIKTKKLTYRNEKGELREWDAIERTTKKSNFDGVDIIAFMKDKETKENYLILIEQFRPPCNKYVIEFPAGLIDENETPEEAAIRELKEETGFEVNKIISSSAPLALEPGLTNATTGVVIVDVVPLENKGELPKQQLDEGEHIILHLIKVKDLFQTLQKFSKQHEKYIVDAKVWTFAFGQLGCH